MKKKTQKKILETCEEKKATAEQLIRTGTALKKQGT